MDLIFTYQIIKDKYYSSDTKHTISLITTEYTYKNNILVHLQLNSGFHLHTANILTDKLNKNIKLGKEIFMTKKNYKHSTVKNINKNRFNTMLGQFDISQTAIEQEILEEYGYIDKNNCSDSVQITTTIKNDILFATINFKNKNQHDSFVPPRWLIEISSPLPQIS